MMLKEIRRILQTRRRACLTDIAAALKAEESAVEPMLHLLESKGLVRRVVMNARLCGGCTRCPATARIEWEAAEKTPLRKG